MKVYTKFFLFSATFYLAIVSSAVAGGGPCQDGGQGGNGGQGCTIVGSPTTITTKENRTVTEYILRSDTGELVKRYRDDEDRIVTLTNREERQFRKADRIEDRKERIDTRLQGRIDKHVDKAIEAGREIRILKRDERNIKKEIGNSTVVVITTTESSETTTTSSHGDSYVPSGEGCDNGYVLASDGICHDVTKAQRGPCDDGKGKTDGGQGKTDGGQGKTDGGQGKTDVVCTLPQVRDPATNTCITPKPDCKGDTPVYNPATNSCDPAPKPECKDPTPVYNPDTNTCDPAPKKPPVRTKVPPVRTKLPPTKKPTTKTDPGTKTPVRTKPTPVRHKIPKKPTPTDPVVTNPPCEDDVIAKQKEIERLKQVQAQKDADQAKKDDADRAEQARKDKENAEKLAKLKQENADNSGPLGKVKVKVNENFNERVWDPVSETYVRIGDHVKFKFKGQATVGQAKSLAHTAEEMEAQHLKNVSNLRAKYGIVDPTLADSTGKKNTDNSNTAN